MDYNYEMTENIEEVVETEEEPVEEVKKPQVLLDSFGYWTGQYAIVGGLMDGVEVDSLPEETDSEKRTCYKRTDDGWEFDEDKYQILLSEKEKAKELVATRTRIAELEKQIESTDYQVIKCYEYSLVDAQMPYNITALHEERQAIRDEINVLEDLLKD